MNIRKSLTVIIVLAIAALLATTILALTPIGIYWHHISAVRSYRINAVSPTLNEITRRYWKGDEHLRKVFVDSDETEYLAKLRAAGNVIREIDYNIYRMLIIAEPVDDTVFLSGEPLPSAPNDQENIAFNGLVIDTTKPQELPDKIPHSLRQTNMTDAILWNSKPQGGLFLVQFVGPVKTEWLDEVLKTQASVVDYVGNYAYVLSADNQSAERLIELLKSRDYLQFLGDYEPAMRLSPSLRQTVGRTETAIAVLSGEDAISAAESAVNVIVQVIDGEFAEDVVAQISSFSIEQPKISRVSNYHNLSVTLRASHLSHIASMDYVFAIEAEPIIVKQDLLQAGIVSGIGLPPPNGQQTAAGYLSWLARKGFPATPNAQSPAVNVVDDCQTRPGNTNSAFTDRNLAASVTAKQTGHGFLIAQIIGASNSYPTGPDRPNLSVLGIAPFVRVGVTRIFNSAEELTGVTDYAEFDTNKDNRSLPIARVSNNSWGITMSDYSTRYDELAQKYDELAFTLGRKPAAGRTLTYVFAAGNNADADLDGIPEGSTISSPGIAKNVITVGASESPRKDNQSICGSDGDSGNDNDIYFFSGRGRSRSIDVKDRQCVNGEVREIVRIKPDLVAPATRVMGQVPANQYYLENLFGCERFYPDKQTKFTWNTGTSFAVPVVSAAAAMLLYKYTNMSPTMVKAWLMNSAKLLTGTYTKDRCTNRSDLASSTQGMGRLDLERAFDDVPRYINDQKTILRSSEQYIVRGRVGLSNKPLRVTLAWSDPPAASGATSDYLKNDLDIKVVVNGNTYIGNLFKGSSSISRTPQQLTELIKGGDRANNVESVYVEGLTAGTSFTITIMAHALNGDGVANNPNDKRQDFALVVYNANSITAGGMSRPSSAYSASSTVNAGRSQAPADSEETLNKTRRKVN